MKRKVQTQIETKGSLRRETRDAEHAEAMLVNLLITAALLRSCLLELSEQSPFGVAPYSSAIQETVELMQSVLLGMGTRLIPSSSDQQRMLNFTFTGLLTISSDDVGIFASMDDVELEVQLDTLTRVDD